MKKLIIVIISFIYLGSLHAQSGSFYFPETTYDSLKYKQTNQFIVDLPLSMNLFSKSYTDSKALRRFQFTPTFRYNRVFEDTLNNGPTIITQANLSINPSQFSDSLNKNTDLYLINLLNVGLMNFNTKVYLSQRLSEKSPISIYAFGGIGIKLLPIIDSLLLNQNETILENNEIKVLAQRNFSFGGGVKFKDNINISFEYLHNWVDLNEYHEDYFQDHISSKHNAYYRSFIAYGEAGGILKYKDKVKNANTVPYFGIYGFVEWNSFYQAFNLANSTRIGVKVFILFNWAKK